MSPRNIAISGILAVVILLLVLGAFGWANADFDFTEDYISKLGAVGQPNALGFNLIGFVMVGVLMMVFGRSYGLLLGDRLLALLLALFGVGYALTAIPVDMHSYDTSASKAHTLAICLGAASWMLGLARISYLSHVSTRIKRRAKIAAILLMTSIIGVVIGWWSMPVAHRLVFAVIFGWTAITSVGLLLRHEQKSRPIRSDTGK